MNSGVGVETVAKAALDDLLDDRPEMTVLIRFAPEDCKACTPSRNGSHRLSGTGRLVPRPLGFSWFPYYLFLVLALFSGATLSFFKRD